MHLADAFIQSDLHCIQVTVSTFYQLLRSLGIEPMIMALLAPCSTSWATRKPQEELSCKKNSCSDSTSSKNKVHFEIQFVFVNIVFAKQKIEMNKIALVSFMSPDPLYVSETSTNHKAWYRFT